MPITQTIPIDLKTRGPNPTAYTHQNDNARTLSFEVYNNGQPFALTNYTAKIGGILPSEKGYKVIAGSSMASGSISNNKIDVLLPSAYTQKAGNGILTIILTTGEITLRPININLIIQRSADGSDTIAGASDFPAEMWAEVREWLHDNLFVDGYLRFLNAIINMFPHVAYIDTEAATYYREMVNAFNELKYTNLVPTSIDSNGQIFDGVGYRNGYYMSGGGVGSADSNATITGYIRLNSVETDGIGDVYRIKGVGEPSASHTRMAFITNAFASKAEVNSFLSGSAGGPMGCFNLTTETLNGETIYCLTVNQKISASYTNVEYIRFSFDGTNGADLVITCNEEIY